MPASFVHSGQQPVPANFWQRTLRLLGWTTLVPIEKVRRMCLDVIDDVPPGHKQGLVSRIAHLRRHTELPEIKPHLFAAVSRHHGEREARTRIQWLDSQIS